MNPDYDLAGIPSPFGRSGAGRPDPRRDQGLSCAEGLGSTAAGPLVTCQPSLHEHTARQLWRAIRCLSPIDARSRLETAEQQLLLEDVESAQRSYGSLLAVRAVLLAREDDTLNASATAEEALRRGAHGEFRRLAGLVVRYCAWKSGAVLPSRGATETTGSLRHTSPDQVLADVLELTLASAIEFSGLRVTAAERLMRAALQRARCVPSLGIFPSSIYARILYEQGKLEEAAQLLHQCLPAIRALGGLDCATYTYAVLARIAAHRGDRASAFSWLDEGRRLAEMRHWPRLLAAMLCERIRLCEPQDEGRAVIWLAQLQNLAELHRPVARCARSEIAGSLHRAQLHSFWVFGNGPSARTALARLRHDAWLSRDGHLSTWVYLADARMCWMESDWDGGVRHLVEALKIVATTGLRQQLLDAGPALLPIIRRFTQTEGADPALLAVANCVVQSPGVAQIPTQHRLRGSEGGGTLTPREEAVLKLIAEGCTNKVIAQIQGVAPETIKTHVKNIFVKLGVERRAQAVSKAERLGLLPGSTQAGIARIGRFG